MTCEPRVLEWNFKYLLTSQQTKCTLIHRGELMISACAPPMLLVFFVFVWGIEVTLLPFYAIYFILLHINPSDVWYVNYFI